MEVIHRRCAGIDVSKKDAKVCVRVQGRGRRSTSTTVSTWGSTTGEILGLREHLLAEQVSCVVIETPPWIIGSRFITCSKTRCR